MSYDPRRRSSFSGPTFGSSGGFAHSDGGYRPNRDGYNDMMFPQEVSGPPHHPPPGMGPGGGVGGPPFPPNMPNPPPMSSFPPPPGPPLPLQPFPGAASFPPNGMGPMNTREPNHFPHDSPGFDPMAMPPRSAPYQNSFEGSPLTDSQFPPPLLEDTFLGGGGGLGGRGRNLEDPFLGGRGRTLSNGGGFGQPAGLIGPAPPMTPYPSHHSKRMRRASSVGPMGFGVGFDANHVMGSRPPIKFRLSGASSSGISVMDALDRVTLSQSRPYMMHDIAPDMYGKITLKVRVWFTFSLIVVCARLTCLG